VLDTDDMPRKSSVVAVAGLRAQFSKVPILALGSADDDKTESAIIKAGAQTYLSKRCRATQLARAIQEAAPSAQETDEVDDASLRRRVAKNANPYGLTKRELDMLEIACFGLSNAQIAKRHKITLGVVKLHLHHAYEKLGVEGRVQAIRVVEKLDAMRVLQLRHAESAPALIDYLLPHMVHERHRAGHVLFRKGEPSSAMYYVQRGKVQLSDIGVTLGEGEIFGELGIFAPAHARTSSALCIVSTDLFKLTAEQTRLLCFENPQFAYYVIRLIADRLARERTK
jgi:DNA-binding NarL/FixJ family response regulator